MIGLDATHRCDCCALWLRSMGQFGGILQRFKVITIYGNRTRFLWQKLIFLLWFGATHRFDSFAVDLRSIGLFGGKVREFKLMTKYGHRTLFLGTWDFFQLESMQLICLTVLTFIAGCLVNLAGFYRGLKCVLWYD